MSYITVYTTSDESEVAILRSLFNKEKIAFDVLGEEIEKLDTQVAKNYRVQVDEADHDKAKEILHESGFINTREHAFSNSSQKKPFNRWIFVFMAALIVVLVALIVAWLMNTN